MIVMGFVMPIGVIEWWLTTAATTKQLKRQVKQQRNQRQQQGQFEDCLPNLLYRPNSRIKLVSGEEIIGTITGNTRYWYVTFIDGGWFIRINKGFVMYVMLRQAPQVSQNVGAVPTNGSVRKGDEDDR